MNKFNPKKPTTLVLSYVNIMLARYGFASACESDYELIVSVEYEYPSPWSIASKASEQIIANRIAQYQKAPKYDKFVLPMTEEERKLMSEHPECDKLAKVRHRKNNVEEFVEWLQAKDIQLCSFHQSFGGEYKPVRNVQALMLEFFGIDAKKLEAERDAIMEQETALSARNKDAQN